jgi:hypothetical protein
VAKLIDSILWRRLDTPGHDACGLHETNGGWRLEGAAVCLERGAVARLAYRVSCDSSWRTQHGDVSGYLGSRALQLRVERSASGLWTLNGAAVPGLEGCVDLDLGFTPATNLLPIRRCALSSGQSADVRAAWLDVWAGALERLDQRYSRESESTYWYEAPRFAYADRLEIGPEGFVRRYPSLWEEEVEGQRAEAQHE